MSSSSSKIQLIRLEPESIDFSMVEKEPTVQLKVINTSEKMIAFKVKTTHPKRYLVRPNQDVISVDGASNVRISLQVKDAKQLRQEKINGIKTMESESKDNRFLVQCVVVKDQYLSDIEKLHEEGNTKEINAKLKAIWQETTRDEFVNRKLMCNFKYPKDMQKLVEANEVEGVSIPFAAYADDGTGGSGASGESHQQRNVLGGDGSHDSGKQMEDVAELRKKYNELITFTVQLTAERDRFKASLKEATKELQILKKGQSGKAASSSRFDNESEGGTGGALSTEGVAGAFSLWQIMLVAVVAFLMGRLVI